MSQRQLLQAAAQWVSTGDLVSGLQLEGSPGALRRIRLSVVARMRLERAEKCFVRWERTRIVDFERVEVLLIGISCIWAMWLLGREHEQVPMLKPTTSKPQLRRKSIIQCGMSAFTNASKQKRSLTLSTPPQPRVLDYIRTFPPLVNNDVMQ
jgi:hypothetical protein